VGREHLRADVGDGLARLELFALPQTCVVRLIGAFTLPVSTMVWLSTVITIGAIAAAVVVAGGAVGQPIEKMIDAEVAA